MEFLYGYASLIRRGVEGCSWVILVQHFIVMSGALMPGPMLAVTIKESLEQG